MAREQRRLDREHLERWRENWTTRDRAMVLAAVEAVADPVFMEAADRGHVSVYTDGPGKGRLVLEVYPGLIVWKNRWAQDLDEEVFPRLRRFPRITVQNLSTYEPTRGRQGPPNKNPSTAPPASSPADPLMSEYQMEFRMSLMSSMNLPPDWLEHLSSEADKQYWEDLQIFLREERADHEVYPGEEQVFDAFRLCSYEDTRVVILGQDPYHQPDQAHGLSFSVPFGTRRPRSLINIYKELEAEDFPFVAPQHGNLESWARQGVLLLNTSLTVRNSEPGKNGHREHWEKVTDRVLDVLNQKPTRVVFILWGGSARAKARLIDKSWHCVIQSAHPTARPNAHDPFLGSRPFSRANACLDAAGLEPINWASVSELGVAEPS